jgi:hypothetical protein
MKRVPAVLVAAALSVGAGCQSQGESALGQRPTAYPAAGEQQGPAAPAGRRALIAAAQGAAEAALGYDYRTLDKDLPASNALMTPAFRRSYKTFITRVRGQAVKQHARASATVIDAAVIGSTSSRASVLIFVDQSMTTIAGSRATGSSAVLTLSRQGGRWLLASLETTAPERPVVDSHPGVRAALAAATAVADAYADLDWHHPTADVARVLSLSTGEFHEAYKVAAPELIRRTTQSRAIQHGTVIAAGLDRIEGNQARALVALTGTTQVGDDKPVPRPLRLAVTLVRQSGTWLATAVRVVPAPTG